jgi:hypothetical protein
MPRAQAEICLLGSPPLRVEPILRGYYGLEFVRDEVHKLGVLAIGCTIFVLIAFVLVTLH